MLDKNKVAVAMSGGVDSTVAAYLLKEKGMQVIGLHMKISDDIDEQVEKDFIAVCEKMDIPYHIVDLRERFKKDVIEYFVREYQSGNTPNPCIVCNKQIKFGVMLEEAEKLGAYYLATGHYAKIKQDETDEYYIEKANSLEKDQTYMFYNFNQEILKHVLMPLGEFDSKEKVREIAKEIDIDLQRKKDSQEICFIPNDDYVAFLLKNGIKNRNGKFVDKDDNLLGEHKGIINYTIGQRKGLGVSFGKPMYVIDIQSKNKKVVLGENDDLMKNVLIAKNYNFISEKYKDHQTINVKAKIRYSAKEEDCVVEFLSDYKLKVTFKNRQRAITPGQSIVFYCDNRMIGGGVIEK
jgi:tRNA-specific 2-thiouridylase